MPKGLKGICPSTQTRLIAAERPIACYSHTHVAARLVGVVDAGVAGAAVRALERRCARQLEVPRARARCHLVGGARRQPHPPQRSRQLRRGQRLVRAPERVALQRRWQAMSRWRHCAAALMAAASIAACPRNQWTPTRCILTLGGEPLRHGGAREKSCCTSAHTAHSDPLKGAYTLSAPSSYRRSNALSDFTRPGMLVEGVVAGTTGTPWARAWR